MRSASHTYIIVATSAIALVGFIGWRVHSSRQPSPVPHVVLVHDRSLSSRGGCSSLVGLAARALSDPSLNRHSTIIVLATGDAASANEPVEVARYEAPASRRAMEGRRGSDRRRRDLLADLDRRCRELPRTDTSPLFLALQRGAEQLKALGCSRTSPCHLHMQTDGQETVESAIVRALRPKKRKSHVAALPQITKPEGLRLGICGLAETVGNDHPDSRRRLTRSRTAARLENHRRIWTALLGPDAVFEPLCPRVQTEVTTSDGERSH